MQQLIANRVAVNIVYTLEAIQLETLDLLAAGFLSRYELQIKCKSVRNSRKKVMGCGTTHLTIAPQKGLGGGMRHPNHRI
ncbi:MULTISPECIES: hypothetical protein [unclassified Rhizobium]|uniref:hypothetical protein n=1 Tax=unclassified Rhizobium TaxID=2613769 RepID=UPI001ADC6CA5|nr:MULTISPECIES: hypothetical protein [unclassified Rhizobium]MBO9102358.1 hypothetical protein [Rhizobium sp. L58/93]MBO9172395.1 hypothetical protein [Rhizobium sp. L245/93]QXZ88365.1 hypothetical protein J5287_31565 [Rhizobium sp. K1/93]QXZ94404.1 hypothetical protein J5280_31100 [Rhizobium sp. K15/93]QYA05828.1 hypothetical protein J5278_30785 [Rhizobium sp. B21/90]